MTRTERDERKWIVSKIAPFASNLWFEVHECSSAFGGNFVDKYVRVLHNERIMRINSCASDFCTMDEFKRALGGGIIGCDFEKVCQI